MTGVLIKRGSLDTAPHSGKTPCRRPTTRQGERPRQTLPSQPSEGTHPTDNLVLDLQLQKPFSWSRHSGAALCCCRPSTRIHLPFLPSPEAGSGGSREPPCLARSSSCPQGSHRGGPGYVAELMKGPHPLIFPHYYPSEAGYPV